LLSRSLSDGHALAKSDPKRSRVTRFIDLAEQVYAVRQVGLRRKPPISRLAAEAEGESGDLAVLAAIAVQNAQVLAQIQRLAAQLQSALQARGVIDRAVGILMSRTGGTEGEAMARLRALSQNEHQQLEVVAGQILEEAVRRPEAGQQGD
jgi:ANTAR domain